MNFPPVGLGTMGIDDPEPIAWATAKEPVATIPKASSERHLRADLAAADLELDPGEIAAIDAVEPETELFPE